MGGNHSRSKEDRTGSSAVSPLISARSGKFRLFGNFISMSSSGDNRRSPYPYPRSHTLFALSPSHSSSIPVQTRPQPGTFRPPLNRAIPTIPESRSNESLRTVSSMSASNSKHSISQEAKTPVESKPAIGSQLSTTREEEDAALVIENPMVSQSFIPVSSSILSQKVPTKTTPKAARSPIIRAYSKVKSTFRRRSSENSNRLPSSGSSEGSTHSLSGGRTKLKKKDSNDNRSRTVSESVSEMVLSNSQKQKDENANLSKVGETKMKKTKSLEESFRHSKKWKKKEETRKPDKDSISNNSSSAQTITNASGSTSATLTPSPVVRHTCANNPVKEDNEKHMLTATPEPGFLIAVKTSPPLARPNVLPGFKMKTRKNFEPPGSAPLAESESSTVENSPAVELPPGGIMGQHPGKKFPWYIRKAAQTPRSPLAEENKFVAVEPLAGTHFTPSTDVGFQTEMIQPSTYAYSRLRSANKYSAQQRAIYGISERKKESQKMNATNEPKATTSMYIASTENTPKVVHSRDELLKSVVNPVVARRLMFAGSQSYSCDVTDRVAASHLVECGLWTDDSVDKTVLKGLPEVHSPKKSGLEVTTRTDGGGAPASPSKNERHDSGIRISGGESSASSMADSNASKVTSPSSEYKGLIDDEIRDQPELIGSARDIACLSLNPSNEDAEKMDQPTDLVGPVRRNSSLRRSTMRDSLNSTTSVDSDDCMLDFDASIDLGVPGEDDPTESSGIFKKSFRNNMQRSRNRSLITADGPTGRSSSHRYSMEISLDELNEMQNQLFDQQNVAKEGSSQSHGESLNGSEMKTESRWSRSLRGSGLPILKPPPSLSQECVGQAPVCLEAHVYRSMVQDMTVLKTLLHRLKGELQKAETVNPFESSGVQVDSASIANGNVKTGISVAELSAFKEDNSNLTRENIELRDQLASLKQQLAERDAMIRRLQLQLQRNSSSTSPCGTSPSKPISPSKPRRTDV